MRFLNLVAAAVFGMVCCSVAQAQYDPGASMDLGAGMGATALGQSTLSGTRNIGKGKAGSDELSPTMKKYCAQWPNEGVCKADRARRAKRKTLSGQASHPSREEVNARMKAIAPEYNRRVRLYGKAKADHWLALTAREMGRRDGAAARQAAE
jgi:hypothetical protein